MMSTQTLSTADSLFVGRGYDPAIEHVNGRGGVPIGMLTKVSLGTPEVADPDLLIDDATGTELPDTETVTYTAADDGSSPFDNADTPAVASITAADGSTASVWPLDVPRNLACVATHDTAVAAMTIMVTGYDVYKRKLVESFSITATGTSKTATGNKAFAYVESIAITAAGDAEANTLTVGSGSKLGLPYKLGAAGDVVSVWVGTAMDLAGATLAAAVTDTATATTGDVRGTLTPNETLDGSKAVTVWMHVAEPNASAGLAGVAQYAG